MFRGATFLLAAMAHASENPNGCSSSWCSSPDGQGGTDCWAGPYSEPCSCSQGAAYPVGQQYIDSLDATYTQYTCCTAESGLPTQGSSCEYPGVSGSPPPPQGFEASPPNPPAPPGGIPFWCDVNPYLPDCPEARDAGESIIPEICTDQSGGGEQAMARTIAIGNIFTGARGKLDWSCASQAFLLSGCLYTDDKDQNGCSTTCPAGFISGCSDLMCNEMGKVFNVITKTCDNSTYEGEHGESWEYQKLYPSRYKFSVAYGEYFNASGRDGDGDNVRMFCSDQFPPNGVCEDGGRCNLDPTQNISQCSFNYSIALGSDCTDCMAALEQQIPLTVSPADIGPLLYLGFITALRVRGEEREVCARHLI